MFNDLSLITCSYNTPDILELCLKSFVFHHGPGPHKIIIMENSTNKTTHRLLDHNNISYTVNPGATHSSSVDICFGLVNTKYTLLIDTDIIFRKNISEPFNVFRNLQLTLFGQIQGDRGGFLLYPRIAPYCCFIDMQNIMNMKINFHHEERIINTNSSGFFKNLPINFEEKSKQYYDVGSVFYEDVKRNHLQIMEWKDIDSYIFHAESLSWAVQSGIDQYVSMGKNRHDNFYNMAKQYKDVDIKNCFEGIMNNISIL